MITIHQRYRQTDRETDRQTTCDRNTALCTKVHRAVNTIGIVMYACLLIEKDLVLRLIFTVADRRVWPITFTCLSVFVLPLMIWSTM